MKKIMFAIGVIIIILAMTITAMAHYTTSEDYIPSETTYVEEVELKISNWAFEDTDDKIRLEELIFECQERKKEAHNMAEAARALGYEETHPVIVAAGKEWNLAHNYYNQYTAIYENIKRAEEAIRWSEKMKEYPEATTIWKYMKELGYNDYVCAGIMGNLMTEVGGNTLNIKYWLKGSYYGMCQWNKAYKEVWGADRKGQCDFLKKTIEYELDTFGYAYKKGFDYDDFLSLTNEKNAALAFAKCYERCASGSYNMRQKNATVAYNYFVS